MKIKVFFNLLLTLTSFASIKTMNFSGENLTFEYCDGPCPKKEGSYPYFEVPNKRRIVVNNTSGKRVGEVSFGASKNDRTNSYEKCRMNLIFVINDYKNRGIGGELFKRAITAMAEDGCQTIEWTSYNSAVPFYKKMGIPDSAFGPSRNYTEVKYQLPPELTKSYSNHYKNETWFEKMKHKFHDRFK